MKFTCEKNALVSAISVASRTVAQKSTIPALEGIYIRAGVKLTLSGYNLETGITISVDADIQQTGACIMPSRLFFDIIRKLTNLSLPDIGKEFGRDHSTVIHSLKKVEQQLAAGT